MSKAIPFVRREAVRALKSAYETQSIATTGIDKSMRSSLAASPGRGLQAEIDQAIAVTQDLYRANVFPAMKIAWGTYRNQTGHTTSDGCFRCHDGSHKTMDGRTISNECETCHSIE
jgi:hypothetical protein